jgi:L-lactate utilization protein LutB
MNTIDINFIKTRANLIRHNYIENMDTNLLAFESKLSSNRIKVQWVIDEDGLVDIVHKLLPKRNHNKVCFEYKHLPEEFTRSSKEIQPVSVENFALDAADLLFIHADYGIVEDGSIILIDKKTIRDMNKISKLVILLDIDKLLLKQEDLETMLMISQDIQKPSLQVRDLVVIRYPFQRVLTKSYMNSEDDVQTENVDITLLLYDNGISTIMENGNLREALYCINCGKCGKVCPVFKLTGAYTPIELIKYHCFPENQQEPVIFKNTSLCGNCNSVCPVNIPLTELLVEEMEMANSVTFKDSNADHARVFSKRTKLNKINHAFWRYFFVRKYYGKNKKLYNYFKKQKDTFFNIEYETITKKNL